MTGDLRGFVMRLAKIAILALLLSGCAPEQEVFNRPTGIDQAQLNRDYAACQVLALQTPEVHNETNIYTSHTTTIGNQTTTTTGPDPYAQVGQNLRDAFDNDDRQTAIRRWCMQAKGYGFAGTRPAPQ
jgi:hypothetical protein